MRTCTAWALAGALMLAGAPALAQADKPTHIGVGVFTFTSGPAAAYGLPAKNAAELIIHQINSAGGIGGVPLRPIYVDEGQGSERVVAEFSRLAADPATMAMIAALSSANCLALAPIAERLQMPTFMWNCDTHQLFLHDRYNYVYRTNSSTAPEFLAFALYLMSIVTDVKRIAIVNPDYAFGRDAALIFKESLKAIKPGVEVAAELYPSLGSSRFDAEIARVEAANPDVIFSNLWGEDLERFVRDAVPRGLFRGRKVILALGESVLQRVGTQLPEGVIVGVIGDGWWLSPDAQARPATRAFIDEYRRRYNGYPVFPSFKMANSILALKAVYEKALFSSGSRWPTREELASAAKGLKIETLTGTLELREDNDGLVDQIVGVTKHDPAYPFPIMGELVRYPAPLVTPPVGVDPIAWIARLKPDVLGVAPTPGSYR